MKKAFTSLMVGAMAVSLLAGCGGSSSTASSAAETQAATEAATEAAGQEESEAGEAAAAEGTDEVWAAIQESGTIKVGTETAYSPYAYRDADGNMTGFDVEIAEALYGKMGLEVEWMDTGWDSLIASLDAQKCDVVMDQIAITDERKEKYIFSDVYTYTYGGLMVNSDSGITGFDNVSGKTFAETATCNWNQQVKDLGGEITETTGFVDSVQLVEQGRADAILIENLTELDYLKNQPDSKLQIVATTDEPVETAVMMRQGCTELQAAINDAMAELMADGTFAEISEKYFGEDVTVQQ